MKTGGVWLLAALAAGCGKKAEATPAPDAAAKKEATSCLHAQNARAYVWRRDPLELALDVELDWTCKGLNETELELTDNDIGAKFGDQKLKERYRLDKDGGFAEWDDPFLVGQPRLRGLFLYSIPRPPTAVGLRYGGVQIVPVIPVFPEYPKQAPKPSMKVIATSSEPGKEKGMNRITALVELDDVPRSAGRGWKAPGQYKNRVLFFVMTGALDNGGSRGDNRSPDRTLDVDEKLVPVETPVASLAVRPAKRFVLAEVSATKTTDVLEVRLPTSEGQLSANADRAAKLVLPKETRARLDSAPPSADVEVGKTP